MSTLGKHWKIKDTSNMKGRCGIYKHLSHQGFQKGKKHWAWKGGICKENYKLRRGQQFKKWRKAVFARDNWTCWICVLRGSEIHPHHLKRFANYPKLRFIINNGLTLCKECHKIYTRYGEYYKNLDQRRFEEALLQNNFTIGTKR